MPDNPTCAALKTEYDNPATLPARKRVIENLWIEMGCEGDLGNGDGSGGGNPPTDPPRPE